MEEYAHLCDARQVRQTLLYQKPRLVKVLHQPD